MMLAADPNEFPSSVRARLAIPAMPAGFGVAAMQAARDAAAVLHRDFLESRCKILEIAAALDRLDRAPEHPRHSPDLRLAQLRQAIEALLEPGPGRAETIQLIFSLPYDPNWQAPKNGNPPRRH